MTLPVFPTLLGIGWGISKTPMWSTQVMTAQSGVEYRSSNWSYPRWKFSLPVEFLRQFSPYSEYSTLVGFCNQMNGQQGNFLYNDASSPDNTVTSQPLGVGTGSQTAFPLVRTLGGFTEPILAVNAISQVTVNGTPTSAYTLSSSFGYANDTINFTTAPLLNAAVAATFTFYFVCRFLSDEPEFQNFIRNRWSMKAIEFESCK